MIRRRRGQLRTGFTLLELILATGMMSVLAVSMYAALRVAFKARDSALAAVGPARSAQVALDLVRRDLESALPPTGVLAGPFLGHYGLEVSGTSALEFYCVGGEAARSGAPGVPGAAGGAWDGIDPTMLAGVRRMELLVLPLPQTGQMVLVRRTTRNLLSPSLPPPEEEILCRGVRAFVVRYFDGLAWQEAWDSTAMGDALPVAVEVALELDLPPDGRLSGAGAMAEAKTYSTSRIFFLPCHSDPSLGGGGL